MLEPGYSGIQSEMDIQFDWSIFKNRYNIDDDNIMLSIRFGFIYNARTILEEITEWDC